MKPRANGPMLQDIKGLPKPDAAGFKGLVEFSSHFAPRPRISHVLFDFDGTLSLIRQGWPEVMVPMFVEMLPAQGGESEETRRQLCHDDIMRLNGKQTIYQMIQLAERIKERGGTPPRAPLVQARIPAAAQREDSRPSRGTPEREASPGQSAGPWRTTTP